MPVSSAFNWPRGQLIVDSTDNGGHSK